MAGVRHVKKEFISLTSFKVVPTFIYPNTSEGANSLKPNMRGFSDHRLRTLLPALLVSSSPSLWLPLKRQNGNRMGTNPGLSLHT